ncbi:hypothetical protein [Flavobacterium sp.]|jgi:hypothetical protein|uniref:hypothetical protein n=1 Tax=Flavobacterium sp. TaxID=239 RepID=UPI0037BFC22F
MSKLSGYEYYKEKYNNTKPIRGRSVECRPLGARHRDWEQVVKYVENGEDVYGARLYQTDCVKYYPNGDIKLTAETWSTPITAQFIGNHSPFRCYKAHKKLWVSIKSGSNEDSKAYPIPEGENGMMIEWVEGDWYKPVGDIKIQKQVVDREKAKKAREPLEPFLNWAKMIHKLSDGWIMDETRMQYGKVSDDPWRSYYIYEGLPEDVGVRTYGGNITWRTPRAYEWFSNLKEEDYMLAYMALTNDAWKAEDKKVARVLDTGSNNRQQTFHDLKFKWDYIKRQVWQLAENSCDINKTIEVEVGNTAVTRVV